MKKNIIGATLLFVVGAAGVVFWWYLRPKVKENEDILQSDARGLKPPLRVAHDMYAGYYPLRSPELRDRLISRGNFLLEFQDDEANYKERVEKLDSGKVDLAVFTVDSYLLEASGLVGRNKDKYGFPGNIVAVLSESKGSDAIIARDKVKSLDALGQEGVKIAYTPNSPSHHLLKVIMTQMNLGALMEREDWKVETSGSAKALKLLQQGSVDAAVLWEPGISQALKVPGTHKLLSSAQTSGLIVDVLVARDEVLKERGDDLHLLLSQYFQVLYEFRNAPDKLAAGIAKEAGISSEDAQASMDSIAWQSLNENASKWFGIRVADQGASQFQILDTVDYAVSILQAFGDFPSENPLPKGGAFRLINSETIKRLKLYGVAGEITQGHKVQDTLTRRFDSLSEAAWEQLQPLGTLKVRPIDFRSGLSILTEEGQEEVDVLVQTLKRFPNSRIIVEGHTSTKGEREVNIELSAARAEAVKAYLVNSYQVDANRIRAIGFGPDKPFERAGLSYREYLSKLARVEIRLVARNY